MGLNVSTPIVLEEDNKACISFSGHPGNRRIDYRYHFVREGVQCGDICTRWSEYIETQFQIIADIFTKALDAAMFLIKFRDMLMVSICVTI